MHKKIFFLVFLSLIATTFAAYADPELVVKGKHKRWFFDTLEDDENTEQKIVQALLAHAPKLSAEGNFPGIVSLIFPIVYARVGDLRVGAIEIRVHIDADEPEKKPSIRAYFDLARGEVMLAIQRDGVIHAAEKAFGEDGYSIAKPVCPGEVYEALGIRPSQITVGNMMLEHVPFFHKMMKRLYDRE